MLLKAGTYRFNDVLTGFVENKEVLYSGLNYTFEAKAGVTRNCIGFRLYSGDEITTYDDGVTSTVSGQSLYHTWVGGNNSVGYRNGNTTIADANGNILQSRDFSNEWVDGQNINITADTEVDDTFGTWYIANTNYNEVNGIVETKPLAEITYNGETIASLNAGETATLSCEGKKMVSDVVVKVNKVEGGSSSGGIIKVDELPAVGEEGVLYKISTQFSDVILGGSSVVEMLPLMGAEGGFYVIPTKTTENIMVSDGSSTMYFYYIQDENDVFLYGDFEGTGTNDWMLCGAMMGATFGGCISDISEATDTSLYYAVFSAPNGYFGCVNGEWINYLNVYEGIGSVVVNTFVIREYTKLPSADTTANVNGYIAHYSGTNYRYKYFFNSLTFGADGNIKIMQTGMGMNMNGNYSESTSEPSEVIVHTNDNKNTWYIGEGDTLVCGDEYLVLCFDSTPQEVSNEFLTCLKRNSV
jgi:hypothetical protein